MTTTSTPRYPTSADLADLRRSFALAGPNRPFNARAGDVLPARNRKPIPNDPPRVTVIADGMARRSDLVTTGGSFTVHVDFDGGTRATDIDALHDGIADLVADLAGASDIRVLNRGAVLVSGRPS